MNKFIRCLLTCFLIVFPIILNAQKSYINKPVNFPSGHFTLKAALKILSDQTGCVFSYDPTKIIDKQELTITKGYKQTLQATLLKILPTCIQFKFNGKYVVLLKATVANVSVVDTPLKNQTLKSKAIKDTLIIETQTFENTKPDSIHSDKTIFPVVDVSESIVMPDSIPNQINTAIEIPKSEITPLPINIPDTFKITKPRNKPVFEIELAGNDHLLTISTHIGLNNFYSIASIGSDYNKSYHLGIGAGAFVKLSKHFSFNMDVIQYAMIAGKSFNIKVRAATTQISPAFNYSIGQRLRIFAGTSGYIINTRIVKGSTVANLTNYIGYSAIFGVKVDLTKDTKKKI